ncbi:MAG: hypothetical protein U0169_00100 [Polyangiaceae bacterium]
MSRTNFPLPGATLPLLAFVAFSKVASAQTPPVPNPETKVESAPAVPAGTTKESTDTQAPAAPSVPTAVTPASAPAAPIAASATTSAAATVSVPPDPKVELARGGLAVDLPPGPSHDAANATDENVPAPHRLLQPIFPEERYPGDPGDADKPKGDPIRFQLHAYFRAPLRMSWVKRPDGSTKPNEGNYNYRTPFLVDDDYYRSGFAYTRVSEGDFTEMYFNVGNSKFTATVSLQGSLYSDAARPLIDRQLGIAQGWLTYRFQPVVKPFQLRVRLKAGAFWERFGWLPMYDTYVMGRVHQMGGQARVEFQYKDVLAWLTYGVGTHLEALESNQGLTLVNYAHLGASWKETIEGGLFYLDSTAREKRQLKELTDASLNVVGIDGRLNMALLGSLYAATSFVKADQATYLSPALEVMHSYGGRGITENYLGTQRSENGTGSLWNVAFHYDFAVARFLKKVAHASPIPWGGDVTASLFGVYSFVQSKQADVDPSINRDDRKMWKYGANLDYRVNQWVGLSFRYDRVVLNVDDSANTFRIFSPRVNVFTHFMPPGSVFGGEQIFLQYSRYVYNERVRLRPGQVQLETLPDDNVVKLQAQMSF